MRILITGCAGYVGSILTIALSKLEDVTEIIGFDVRPQPERLPGGKLSWVTADTSDGAWRTMLSGRGIDAVIHLAYQVREPYGAKHELQHRNNVGGARNVFEFALGESSVQRLIQFSTVSVYGAQASNSREVSFGEDMPLTHCDYLYARQKQEVEAILRGLYEHSDRSKHIIIVRPASLSGPYGRHVIGRFGGLVSTLTGKLPAIPVGRRDWSRQYIHEDDLAGITSLLLTTPREPGLDLFNLAPDGGLSAADLAALYRKSVMVVPPLLMRMAFSMIWHGSRGALTTPPGAWQMLTYPLRVDGAHLREVYGYRYRYNSVDALTAMRGEHASDQPQPPHRPVGAPRPAGPDTAPEQGHAG